MEGVLVVGGQVNPPPYAPTLLYPTSGQYLDLSGSVTFEWQYNPAQAGLTQTAYAFLLLTNSSTTAQYWNASTGAFQSTQVFNTSSNQYVTFPEGTFTDGYTYQWAVITQDKNGTSPPSPYSVVNAQAAPYVTVTSPSGTVGTSTPIISWTATFPSGASQLGYYVCVYTQTQITAPDFTPGEPPYVFASGFVGGQNTQLSLATNGVFLDNGTTYYFYVQVIETGHEPSAWAWAVGTVSYTAPNAPYLEIEQTTDPNTNYPVTAITVTSQDNWLTAADADPTSAGGYTWVATNASLSTPTSGVLTVTASSSLTTASTVTVMSGTYDLPPGTYFAQVLVNSANTSISRTCELTVQITGGSSYFQEATEPNAEPIVVFTCPEGQTSQVTLTLQIFSVDASEQHTMQDMGIFTWISQAQQQAITSGQVGPGAGGFRSVTNAYIIRSDGLAVRGASYANPLYLSPDSQSVTIYDYECVPTVVYTYTGYTTYTPSPNVYLMSLPDTSNAVIFTTTEWWEIDPTNPPSAVAAQPTQWQPVNTEQSQAHIVTGQPTMNMVANVVMHQDFQATFETFHVETYQALDTLTKSQRIIFVSSPWGVLDSGYFRFGPQTGGMSTGVGNQTKNTNLLPSTASQPHRTIQVTAVAQPRPGV